MPQSESGIEVQEGTVATESGVEKVESMSKDKFLAWYMERYATNTMGELAKEFGIKSTSFQAKVSKLRGELAAIPKEQGGPFRLPSAVRAKPNRKKRINTLATKAAELNLQRLLNEQPAQAATETAPVETNAE